VKNEGSSKVVSRLSMQLEPRSFVRTLLVGAYFRRSIPKSPAFRCNVEETDRQAPEWVPALRDHFKTKQDEPPSKHILAREYDVSEGAI
jgi:hypothetical protein